MRRRSHGQPSRLVLLLAAAVLAPACAHFTSAVKPQHRPAPDSAYLYGRFFIDAESRTLAMDSHQSVGFVFRCKDGEKYTLRFSNKKGVQVVQIRPSRCAFVEVLFTDGDGSIRRRTAVRDGLQDFTAGNAYYLGDFLAEASTQSNWKVLYTEINMNWGIQSSDDNYDLTTAEMKRTHAGFAQFPTVNRSLVEKRRLPGQSRQRPPGDSSAQREPIGPERAARLAPFTKRRYVNPAECEAACPKGECLPYRGTDGPAMTCIVHCSKDQDCPEGLACNCPDGDGSACRLIAKTDGDAMAGICLSTEATGERR